MHNISRRSKLQSGPMIVSKAGHLALLAAVPLQLTARPIHLGDELPQISAKDSPIAISSLLASNRAVASRAFKFLTNWVREFTKIRAEATA